MADGHERISPTAHVTAYTWHHLRLPHARLFATPGGRAAFWFFRLVLEPIPRLLSRAPSLVQMLEYRHLLLDHAVAAHEPDLLIEVAGGLSRRGVTFAADHGVRVVEIDLPHMIAAKRAALRAAGPEVTAALAPLHTLAACDVLSDGFVAELTAHLADAERPVVVMEGLLSYFTDAQSAQLLGSLSRALAGRDALVLCELYTLEARAHLGLASAALKAAISVVTRGQGSRGGWPDLDAARRALHDAGFEGFEVVTPEELPAGARPHLHAGTSPVQVVRARAAAAPVP